MNSENAPKHIVQSFIDLANTAKQLINENQQPSVEQELGRLFPVLEEVEGGEVKAESLGLALVNRLLWQLMQVMLVSQHLQRNRQQKKYGGQKQQRNHGEV